MPGIRKLRKAKKFKYDKNRKRVKKTQEKHQKHRIKISNETMKGLWNPKLSIQNNLETMGVAFDANKVVEQKTMKQKIIQKIKNENDLEPIFKEEKTAPVDSDVVKKLESEVKEMEDNRTSCFRFTGEQVKWITYCLDKYGDDFKAMARDPKNIWQETPKQIRQKVLKFVNIPEQFAVYAKKSGLLDQIVKDSPIGGILEQEKIERYKTFTVF